MHSQVEWPDDPNCDCPVCTVKPHKTRAAHERNYDVRAPWPANPEGPVPFLMLRGRWLAQMGFAVGANVKVEALEGKIIISIVGEPTPRVAKVPTTMEREIHYTEVEPHTHITPSKRNRR